MGEKGEKMTNASVTAAEDLLIKLESLGEIRIKKMFGGHGVFEAETMFSLIDKNGGIYFKVDDTNRKIYEDAGAVKHGRMPYYKVPAEVLDEDNVLKEWAQISIQIAQNVK